MRRLVLIPMMALWASCGGAGDFGYSRQYVVSDDEEPYAESEQPVTYEEVRRDPASHAATRLGWFGIVTQVGEGNGEVTVSLTHRLHQERHLCQDERADSCRVTVSDRQSGPFSAIIQIRPEDRQGELRVWIGSLLKIYGSPTGDFDAEGGPVVRARFYRHWPRGRYVTTGAAGSMRR